MLKLEQTFWRHWDFPDPACIWTLAFVCSDYNFTPTQSLFLKASATETSFRISVPILVENGVLFSLAPEMFESANQHPVLLCRCFLFAVLVNRCIRQTSCLELIILIVGWISNGKKSRISTQHPFFGVFSVILWFWVLGQWQIVWCSNYLGCEMTWLILWFASYKLNITSN